MDRLSSSFTVEAEALVYVDPFSVFCSKSLAANTIRLLKTHTDVVLVGGAVQSKGHEIRVGSES